MEGSVENGMIIVFQYTLRPGDTVKIILGPGYDSNAIVAEYNRTGSRPLKAVLNR